MKCAIISNKRPPVVSFLSSAVVKVGGSLVAVSTVKLDWSEKQLEFTSALKASVCVCVFQLEDDRHVSQEAKRILSSKFSLPFFSISRSFVCPLSSFLRKLSGFIFRHSSVSYPFLPSSSFILFLSLSSASELLAVEVIRFGANPAQLIRAAGSFYTSGQKVTTL